MANAGDRTFGPTGFPGYVRSIGTISVNLVGVVQAAASRVLLADKDGSRRLLIS